MKKTLIILLSLGLILSACLPAAPANNSAPQPQVDVNGSAVAMGQTLSAETLVSLSTPSPVIAQVSSATFTQPPASAATATPSVTPTVAIATETTTSSPTAIFTSTNTAVIPSAVPSATPLIEVGTPLGTDHPRFYGTRPPLVPSGSIILSNKAGGEVYVSLQVQLEDGTTTVLEYPVRNQPINVRAPAGKYFYRVVIGNDKVTGNFRLNKHGKLIMTVYKKSVSVAAR